MITIEIRDSAKPKLLRIIKAMPDIVDKAVRMTAAHHRRKIVAYLRKGTSGDVEHKKLLRPAGVAGVKKNARDPKTRGKHLHRSAKPLSGKSGRSLWNALRYKKAGDAKYVFGFIGNAEFWVSALAKGEFINPSNKRVTTKTITPKMRRYFGALGMKTKKHTLNYPSRPVVEKYFERNKEDIQKKVRYWCYKIYNERTKGNGP